MICEFCGQVNEAGVHFCTRCGAELEHGQRDKQNQQQQQQQMYQQTVSPPPAEEYGNSRQSAAGTTILSMPLKKILLIAIPAVVILLALIVLASMLGNSGGVSRKNHIEFFSGYREIIISGNNNEKFSIDADIESWQLSLDGSKAVALTDYNSRNGGRLWFVTTADSTLIAEDVFAYQLADSGNGVVYLTEYDDLNNEAALYLYDTSGKKATLITDITHYNGYGAMSGVAISPNGKSVGYITEYDERNYEFTGFIKIDGKTTEKLGDEMFAIAISDGGKYLYYQKVDVKNGEASLHVRSGRNEFRLVPDASNVSIMLNKDYSEILLSVYDGDRRTFISRNGSERERIIGAAIRNLILPRGTTTRTYSIGAPNITASNAVVYGINSFADFVAVTEDGLAYYNKKLETNSISGSSNNAYSAEISNDGRTLHFINNSNRLSSIDPTVTGAERN